MKNLLKRNRIFKLLTAAVLSLTMILPLTAYSAEPADTTVEGVGNYFVTGESYPTIITLTGYNSRDKIMYNNLTMETTKLVNAGSTATFHYYIEVYDADGGLIGNTGTAAVPETVTGADGATSVVIGNKAISLSGILTSQFKVVVTVTEVTISEP